MLQFQTCILPWTLFVQMQGRQSRSQLSLRNSPSNGQEHVLCHSSLQSQARQSGSGSKYWSFRIYHKLWGHWTSVLSSLCRLFFFACLTVHVEIQSHILQQTTKANAKALFRTRNETMKQFATSIGFFLCSGVVGMANQHVLKFNCNILQLNSLRSSGSIFWTNQGESQLNQLINSHSFMAHSLHGFIKPEFKSMSPQSGRPRR